MNLRRNKTPSSAAEKQAKKNAVRDDAYARLRITLIAVLAVVAVLLAGAVTGMLYVEHLDTIFPNVTVDGLEIGGLTLSETAAKLADNGYGDLSGRSVSVALPADYTLTLTAEEVCSETPASDIALMAWNACKGKSSVADTLTYARCAAVGMALQSETVLTVDRAAVRAAVENAAREVRLALLDSDLSIGEDSIRVIKGAQGIEVDVDAVTDMIVTAFETENYDTLVYEAEIKTNNVLDIDGIYDTVYLESKDAYYDGVTEKIVPEVDGVSFDKAAASRLWKAAGYGDEVVIPLILTEPEMTAKKLEELLFRDCLGETTSYLWGSDSNRINNVTRAVESINDIVLSPGEEFSYNPALGERTAANGYMLAGAYNDGEVVQEYGGGICQVSSTLYCSCLYANLQITARTCHWFPVGYLPAGMDATVSWGGPEYKFINNREYPIRITAWVDTDAYSVTVQIWGTDVDGSYVEITSGTWQYFDEEWTEVALGYKAQTYRNVYDKDGNLLSRQQEAMSAYHYHDEDIQWPPEAHKGKDEPEPEVTEQPEPEVTPEPTEAPAEPDPENGQEAEENTAADVPPEQAESPEPQQEDSPPEEDGASPESGGQPAEEDSAPSEAEAENASTEETPEH